MQSIDFFDWADKYDPQPNEDETGLFNWTGPDLDAVMFAAAFAPMHLWTVLEVDGEEYAVQGFHRINRLGYAITAKPAEEVLKEYHFINLIED